MALEDADSDEELGKRFMQLMNYQQAQLLAKYKADTYGGKTPEETWKMFVDALKAGDTDLAAKYFIVEKQKEMLSKFEAGSKSGALVSFLKNDVKLISGGDMYDDGTRFEYYTNDIDGGPGFVYTLILNPETNLWKIESL